MSLDGLIFDKDNLIPAVVQDFFSKEVLTVAYMNPESLKITIDEKRTCFWSRSRKQLWRKGETSGNIQRVVSVATDCDRDALVIQVIKDGPACHTGSESCFFEKLFCDESVQQFSLKMLYELIEARKTERKEGSYTNYLLEKGKEKILKKVGEESAEVIIAAMKEDRTETVFEISDLCYHILVLMAHSNIRPEDVCNELAKRHIVDHKVKQETLK